MKFQSSSSARGLLIGALIMVAASENAAVAQEPRTQGQLLGDVRAGLFGGAFIPNSIQFTGQGALSTIPFLASGKISMDPSAAVGGFLGYTVNEFVNIEGNLGYSSGNLKNFTGKLDLGPFGSTTGKFPLRGSTSMLAGFVNVMFNPFGISEFTPYIGG